MEPIMMLGWNAEMYDALRQHDHSVSVYDDNPDVVPKIVHAGTWDYAADVLTRLQEPIPVVIGVASSAAARMRAADWLTGRPNWQPFTLVSRHACVSPRAKLGPGVFVADCAYVGPYVTMRAWSCALPGAKIMHDSQIGVGSIIVGNATVLGRAIVGNHCWICAAATVLPDAFIDDGLVVPYRGVMRKGVPDVPPQE